LFKDPVLPAPTTISGHLFIDSNNNGTQSGTESNLGGIPVKITDSLGNIQTVYTDTNGNYTAVVAPGAVTADVDQNSPLIPAGSTISTNPSGGTDTQTITAITGVNTPTKNIGLSQTTKIKGHLFYDSNNDGIQQPTEPNLSNVSVTITDSIGHTQVVDTDGTGNYIVFVAPGIATVIVNTNDPDIPAGSIVTTGSIGGTATQTITAILGSTVTDKSVGFFRPNAQLTSVSGHIFNDVNGDGIQQPTEPNLPGVDIEITDSTGIPFIVSTDSSGNYVAVVSPGNVTAKVVLSDTDIPVGAIVSTNGKPLGSVSNSILAVINSNTQIHNVGFNQPIGYVSGHLFYDSNNDGIQQPTEPNLPGVTITIVDVAGVSHITITDTNGNYELQLPVGQATVMIQSSDPHILPLGSTVSTAANGGTLIQLVSVVPSPLSQPKVVTPTKNIGFHETLITTTTVSGHIWSDQNGDGIQQPTEPNLPNISVQVTDSLGNSQTVYTDENGNYRAVVIPGTTIVVLDETDSDIPPFTKISTNSTGGTGNQTITVIAGQDNVLKQVGFFGFDPEVILSKSANKDTVRPGDIIVYTIDFENIGIGDAIGGLFIEQLPKYVAFVNEQSDPGWTCSTNPNGSQTCTHTIDRINSHAKGKLKIAVRVLDIPDDVGELINSVSLSIENGHGKTLTSNSKNTIKVQPTLKSLLIRTGGILRNEINKQSNSEVVFVFGFLMLIAGITLSMVYFAGGLYERNNRWS
jgi:large repetitive protein